MVQEIGGDGTAVPAALLVLGLGNDILGDDAVGLLAARRLRAFLPDTVDVSNPAAAAWTSWICWKATTAPSSWTPS